MYRQFSSPVPIIFGCGAVSILGEKIKERGCKKALLIFEPGIEGSGIIKKATASLDAAGVKWATFNGVLPDPPDAVVDQAGAVAIKEGADCIVGIGGGSSLDTAKASSILLTNPGPARKYILAAPIFMDTKTPVFLVPTTAGTGSECTRVAIISIPDKNAKWSVFVNTTLAIVDPELTLSLPKSETANTGLDAFAHAAEGMTSLDWNPHSDLFGEAAIKKISRYLRVAYHEPGNITARSEMSLAANWAGLAFNDPLTHVGHAISDALSGHFHTAHGLGCALALPETMALIAPASPDKIRVIAAAMGIALAGDEPDAAIGKRIADEIRSMMRDLNIKSLRELGHSKEEVVNLYPDVVSSHLCNHCPVKITDEVAKKLLADVYDTYQ